MSDTPRRERPKRPKRPRPVKTRPPAESVDTRQRVFLAVPLPPDVRALVERTTTSLAEGDWPVRWTTGEQAHITLHFLGELEPEDVEILRMALRAPIAAHERFDLRTADLSVFPKLKSPRVIFLSLYGPAHRLHTLRDAIGAVLTGFEIPLDRREFHPHITLGRLRDIRTSRVRDLPEAIRKRFAQAVESGEVTAKSPLAVPVDEVVLVRSHLERDGARYEVLERFPLASPSTANEAD